MLLEPAVHVEEQNALLFEVFSDGMVDCFGLVLSSDSTEPLLFCFRNAEPIEGVLDVVRNIVPVLFGGVR